MLPALDQRGLLPDGVHSAGEVELEARFADSPPRQRIFGGFMRLRREAESFGLAGMQWVDGSFVTAKAEPSDLDVVTFCDYDLLNRLSPIIEPFYARALSAEKDGVRNYGCDTYAVPACAADHAYFPVFEKWRVYWRKYFATVRDPVTGRTIAEDKGFVSLPFGDPALVPAVRTTR